MKSNLNILIICNKSPWPPREGGPIAMNNIIEGLCEAGHSVKVLAINTNKYFTNVEDIPLKYREKTNIELGYIDLSIKPVPAFLNLFTNESYHVSRFVSTDFEQILRKILDENSYDIVQIETLFMSPYINIIRELSDSKVVLRAHNIEHMIWKRIASVTRNPLKKVYLKHLYRTLENYERTILNSYDGIIPISSEDEGFFKDASKVPVKAISFGINFENFQRSDKYPDEISLFHIGAMNWMPNEEGISWFLDKVWPLVHKKHSDLKLYLAGREMPQWLVNSNIPNVVVVGEVPDAHEFIRSKCISIAPLLSGSGIRIKIIESMALGKPVISTTIGAEGINYTSGKNIIIADDENKMADAVSSLASDREYCESVGRNAADLIDKEHNNKKLIESLAEFYYKLIANNS